MDYKAIAAADAQKYGLDPGIFTRQINQESGFNPFAISPAGAVGIAQIMPATARGWGVDPTDPVASLEAAAKHDRMALDSYGGDWRKTLAAYNAGGGAVEQYGGVPPYPETINYVNSILGGGSAGPIAADNPPTVTTSIPAVAVSSTKLAADAAAIAAASSPAIMPLPSFSFPNPVGSAKGRIEGAVVDKLLPMIFVAAFVLILVIVIVSA